MTTAVLRQEPEHVRALVTRLMREYGDRLPTDTVVEVVRSCYQPLACSTKVGTKAVIRASASGW